MRFDIVRNGQHVETHYAEDAVGVEERAAALNSKLDDGEAQFSVAEVASESKSGNPLDGKGALMEQGLTKVEYAQKLVAEARAAEAAELAAAEAAKAG